MMRKNLWIACGVTVIVVMAGLLVYGSYISAQYQMEALQTATHEQWVQLDGALRRLADVTPQLASVAEQDKIPVDTLRGARQMLVQARDPQAVIAAGHGLDHALAGVMTVAARHPDLQMDVKFQQAQERLLRMQARVAQDRDRYNESLRNYNTFVGNFPNSMWAKVAGFHTDHRFFTDPSGANTSATN